jgi:hypothetical protein
VGYQITAVGVRVETLTDRQWMEILLHASKHGFSAPRLTLDKDEEVEIGDDDAEELRRALGEALVSTLRDAPMSPSHSSDDDVLDRDTVHRIRHVLHAEDVRLACVPYWMAGG